MPDSLPSLEILTLPELFSTLESSARLGWGPAQVVLMRRISALLGLPVAQEPGQSGNGPTPELIRQVVISAVDARFAARDAGEDSAGQFGAALVAALDQLVQPGARAPSTGPDDQPRALVALALQSYDSWMAAHGATDGLEGERAIDAAVQVVLLAMGQAGAAPQNITP